MLTTMILTMASSGIVIVALEKGRGEGRGEGKGGEGDVFKLTPQHARAAARPILLSFITFCTVSPSLSIYHVLVHELTSAMTGEALQSL